jgi:hypothetical protein
MKVTYRPLGSPAEYTTQAYVDDEEIDGIHHGTNKHTYVPVALRWDDDQDAWLEVLRTCPAAPGEAHEHVYDMWTGYFICTRCGDQ